jgi:hypothetical protein
LFPSRDIHKGRPDDRRISRLDGEFLLHCGEGEGCEFLQPCPFPFRYEILHSGGKKSEILHPEIVADGMDVGMGGLVKEMDRSCERHRRYLIGYAPLHR